MELKDKTTEKLESEIKKIKTASGSLVGVLLVLFIVCLYGIIRNPGDATFIALLVTGIVLSATIPINNNKIKAELESRQANKS